MTIETIYLSQKNKDQLLKLKRFTGIQNWNILCRWALCLSLSDREKPREAIDETEHAIEMTWRIFGGHDHEIYSSLLIERCKNDKITLEKSSLQKQLKLHLNRGIEKLISRNKNKNIRDFIDCSIDKQPS